jgi:hypothetical protein
MDGCRASAVGKAGCRECRGRGHRQDERRDVRSVVGGNMCHRQDESRKAEKWKEASGPRTGEWTWGILQKELPEGELLQKGILKKGLRRIKPTVGGKDVKAAN